MWKVVLHEKENILT